jgi:hypothetical protein
MLLGKFSDMLDLRWLNGIAIATQGTEYGWGCSKLKIQGKFLQYITEQGM